MIEHIENKLNFGSISNTAGAATGEINPGFEKLLAEKAVSNQVVRHGFVGDGQDLCPEINEESIELINSLMSLTDDLDNIWEIVLRLEEKVDMEALSENIVEEFDNAAGRNSIAALLTRFWKKKELTEDDVTENGDISTRLAQNLIENAVASELEAILHKNQERKFMTLVNSDLLI